MEALEPKDTTHFLRDLTNSRLLLLDSDDHILQFTALVY